MLELKVRDANRQAHIDIQKYMFKQGKGLFSFTIKINRGNITDCTIYEYKTGGGTEEVPRKTGK